MEKNLDFVVYKKFIIPSKIGINLEGKDKSNIFLKSETSKYACVPISISTNRTHPKTHHK